MKFDIASELGEIYDLTQTVPSLTTFFIAASGIFLLCAAIGLILMTKRYVGLRFFPILYGCTAYLLFYVMAGSFLTSLVSFVVPKDAGSTTIAFARVVALLMSTIALVAGRFFAMWFIRKYYSDYSDAYGVGVGVSLTEGIITGATIFVNYCLCITLTENGLVDLVNSYSTVEEATLQLEAVLIFYKNPSYIYLLSGLESLIFLVFHTMISVLYYAVYHGEMKKLHLLTITGLQFLIYLPNSLYSSGVVFNCTASFTAEVIIFIGCILFFLRMHNTFYRDWEPAAPNTVKSKTTNKKMPNFNERINKL